MFRFMTMIAVGTGALLSMGTIIVWFVGTTFASNDSLQLVKKEANKMMVRYTRDMGNIERKIAVINEKLTKLDKLERISEEQNRMLYKILIEVKK